MVVNSVFPENFALFERCTSLCFTPQSSYALSNFDKFCSLKNLAINFLSLQELDVHFASSFTRTSLASLLKLEKLCLKGCEVEDLVYPPMVHVLTLEDCPNLINLPFTLNRISIKTCPKLTDFTALQRVDAASLDCPLVDSKEYARLSCVKRLQVRGSISDKELDQLVTLIWLDVSYCINVTRVPKLPFLEFVCVEGCGTEKKLF